MRARAGARQRAGAYASKRTSLTCLHFCACSRAESSTFVEKDHFLKAVPIFSALTDQQRSILASYLEELVRAQVPPLCERNSAPCRRPALVS
eukprot:6206419-Pleurochrysis_carterae.AAC.3